MLFKFSNLNSNFALTLSYLNSALNNSAQYYINWPKITGCYSFQFDSRCKTLKPLSRFKSDQCLAIVQSTTLI